MTDAANEDKEVERISQIAIMNGLLARAMRAEVERDRAELERDRLRHGLRRIAKGVANGPRCHAIAIATLKETNDD
jgi:hypothetical protein